MPQNISMLLAYLFAGGLGLGFLALLWGVIGIWAHPRSVRMANLRWGGALMLLAGVIGLLALYFIGRP